MRCSICQRPRGAKSSLMCSACHRSYDRAARSDDGTIMATVLWAAKRARRFEREIARNEVVEKDVALDSVREYLRALDDVEGAPDHWRREREEKVSEAEARVRDRLSLLTRKGFAR